MVSSRSIAGLWDTGYPTAPRQAGVRLSVGYVDVGTHGCALAGPACSLASTISEHSLPTSAMVMPSKGRTPQKCSSKHM